MTKIFLAGIFHETHSFTDDRTGLKDFIIHRGQGLLDRIGDGSQVDGFLTTAAREGWQVVPGASLPARPRSEEHTPYLPSPHHLLCRLLPRKKKQHHVRA